MTADTRSNEEIERDLARNRTTIDETVSALQEKFSPGQLMDKVLGAFREHGGSGFGRNLGETIKNHPVPVLMTAGGLAWLAMSGRGDERRYVEREGPGLGERASSAMHGAADSMSRGAHSLTEHARHTAASAGEQARYAASAAGETASRAAHSVSETARSAADAGRRYAGAAAEGAGNLIHRSGDFFREYPLAAGLVSAGIGAALAAMIPVSDAERERFGPYRERIRNRLKDAASDAKERAKQVGQAMAEEARRSSREEGLTGDRTSEGEGIGDALRRTVERTAEAARNESDRQMKGAERDATDR